MDGLFNMLKFSKEQINTAIGAKIPSLDNIEGQQRQLADALAAVQISGVNINENDADGQLVEKEKCNV